MASSLLLAEAGADAIPIRLASASSWPAIDAELDPLAQAFAKAAGFEPKPGRHCLVPAADGSLGAVLFGVDDPGTADADPLLLGKLPGLLPEGTYRLADATADAALAGLAWCMGGYSFKRDRKKPEQIARLVPPLGIDSYEFARIAEAVRIGRDLVNTPANDLGPDE